MQRARRQPQAARGAQGRRDQGDHAERAVRHRRARHGLKPIVDLAAESDAVAVLDPGGEPEISEGEPRRDGAVPARHRRGQLPRDRRSGARQAGAGQGHARHRSQDRRDHLCRLHPDDAARPVGAARRRREHPGALPARR